MWATLRERDVLGAAVANGSYKTGLPTRQGATRRKEQFQEHLRWGEGGDSKPEILLLSYANRLTFGNIWHILRNLCRKYLLHTEPGNSVSGDNAYRDLLIYGNLVLKVTPFVQLHNRSSAMRCKAVIFQRKCPAL